MPKDFDKLTHVQKGLKQLKLIFQTLLAITPLLAHPDLISNGFPSTFFKYTISRKFQIGVR